ALDGDDAECRARSGRRGAVRLGDVTIVAGAADPDGDVDVVSVRLRRGGGADSRSRWSRAGRGRVRARRRGGLARRLLDRLVGEVCDADAEEPAVGSEPGGGSLPVAPAVADAWALFDCPTACPFPLPLPLPTATATFPLLGEPWSDVAPAWALCTFALGAPLAWSAVGLQLEAEVPGGWHPLPVPLAVPCAA